MRDAYCSSIRSAGDLGGVFEGDDETNYFYLYRIPPTGKPKILKAMQIEVHHKKFQTDAVEIIWSADENIMSLRINKDVVATYNCEEVE